MAPGKVRAFLRAIVLFGSVQTGPFGHVAVFFERLQLQCVVQKFNVRLVLFGMRGLLEVLGCPAEQVA